MLEDIAEEYHASDSVKLVHDFTHTHEHTGKLDLPAVANKFAMYASHCTRKHLFIVYCILHAFIK